ncbi:MAG: fused MFS/spermidine synthase [Microbacteriaceae bacterium]|nr:fused MFS/spermidine synthase [Microbacteriaceae bacterium]
MQQYPAVVLGLSGHRAVIEPDRWVPGAFTLVVDGTPQSHVNLVDPTELFFEYIRRMGCAINLVATPGAPISVLHLGAGALTLPRYIESTRPGSTQIVVELERDLVEFVRGELPWTEGLADIRINDARQAITELANGGSKFDLVIVDVYSGSRIPAHVTSTPFYNLVAGLLNPDGAVLVNASDGPPLDFARSQAATMRGVFADVIVTGEEGVILGRRYGNIVLIASPRTFDGDWVPRLSATGPHPTKVLTGAELETWIEDAAPVSDESAVPSPPPTPNLFRFR